MIDTIIELLGLIWLASGAATLILLTISVCSKEQCRECRTCNQPFLTREDAWQCEDCRAVERMLSGDRDFTEVHHDTKP